MWIREKVFCCSCVYYPLLWPKQSAFITLHTQVVPQSTQLTDMHLEWIFWVVTLTWTHIQKLYCSYQLPWNEGCENDKILLMNHCFSNLTYLTWVQLLGLTLMVPDIKCWWFVILPLNQVHSVKGLTKCFSEVRLFLGVCLMRIHRHCFSNWQPH